MFTESSDIYDLVYSFKDYEKEAQDLKNAINRLAPDSTTILDVACGTGEHHRFLKDQYMIDGLDINPVLLEAAKRKNPAGNYFAADMTDFDPGKRYDVILCIFSSIGYARTLDRVIDTLRCFNRSLNDDGLIIVEPWMTPEAFQEGRLDLRTFEKDGFKISRMNDSVVEGSLSRIRFHFLVGKGSEGIKYFQELHELGLFTVSEMKESFDLAGFKVEFDNDGITGRGLYYGRKK